MSDFKKLNYPSEMRKVPTWVRLESVRTCLATGKIDLAADLFKMIDPDRANEPQVLAVGLELEQARGALARERSN